MMARVNRTAKLEDGRKMGYDDYGPLFGQPVFFLSDTPSSRHNFRLFASEEMLDELAIRVIAVDRPGLGLSDFKSGRQISDFVDDLEYLADRLGLGKFSVVGYSGGGPYALACARRIPKRLRGVTVVSGMGPHNVKSLTYGVDPDSLAFARMAQERPWLSGLRHWLRVAAAYIAPRAFISRIQKSLPEVDARILDSKQHGEALANMIRYATIGGVRGAVLDTALMVRPWDFDPHQISVPVTLWYGEQDRSVPPAMGRYLDHVIPDSTLHVEPEHGHISLFAARAREIFGALSYV